ncbi:flagellar motor switch protein FliN [Pontibacillus halophilus JSM 076056 = DSM 19796]|uniref:Flagellar motor switch protein FliN n=1 Tax=Pontibacillus halophilus JSM 076056 = DSM 19796 TaxID=1385510 RepID=A0A0A5GPJ1_9BACI|nr:flagellar motor switch phosphatase FliY [Pontibacillus halophilus]KGX93163.1 flagellar motor switch protein FliN [Pontibacillus halophilus JSM 076056 = DSM 19796]
MMSDDMLSQEEIDALLNGTADLGNDKEEEPGASTSSELPVGDYFNSLEQDALGEIGNISFGSSATALSNLLNQKVDITTPRTSAIERSRIAEEFPQPHVAVQVNYTEGFSGANLFVIKQQDAAIIADLMLGGDGLNPAEELNEIHLSAVQEAMNQMMGSAATSMSTVFTKKVDISPPEITLLDVEGGEGTEQIPKDDVLAKVSFQLKVGELIDSNIMQLLPVHFAKDLVNQLLNPEDQDDADLINEFTSGGTTGALAKEPATPTAPSHSNPAPPESSAPHTYEAQQSQQPQQPTNQAPREPQQLGGMQPTQEVHPAEFSSFEPMQTLQQSEQKNLDMLLDIPLKVTVELGRTKRTIKEILELSQGSVVELDKLAGEPVDIQINNKPIAKGEVVVIDENFGVRVTDILSQSERLKKLQY